MYVPSCTEGLDYIVFTNAELSIGTAAFPKISAQTTTFSTSTCSPTPIPDRTFEFEIEKGLGWSYFSIVTDYIGPNNTVSSDENIGIRQCKSWCAADLNCRTFAFFVWAEAAWVRVAISSLSHTMPAIFHTIPQ